MYIFWYSSETILNNIVDVAKEYNLEPFKIWLGPYFGVVISKPEDLQVINFVKQ